jgi:clan AA aspartic protease (TIGR02281 family)
MKSFSIAAVIACAAMASTAGAQQASAPFEYGPVRVTDAPRGSQPQVEIQYNPSGWDDTSGETRDANAERRAPMRSGSGWGNVTPSYTGHVSYAGRAAAPADLPTQGYAAPARAGTIDADFSGIAKPVRVPRDKETGHFVTDVLMNGVKVPVIIDTGATGTILSPGAAKATGAMRDVTHTQNAAGIGGVTQLSVTRIRSFAVGGREIGGFEALIGREGIPFTLLGQTELRRLGRIVIEDDVLTITPRDQRVANR